MILRQHVPTVPAAINALVAMERELSQASTYIEIRKIVDQAEALKLLFRDIDIVKAQAEDVILAAGARIGEEIAKVPKATHKGGPKKQSPAQGKSVGREATGLAHTTRARYQKLAAAKPKLKAIAAKLREQGKDATPTAVVRELAQGDKKERRSEREQALGAKQAALPSKRYGVILADPEWRFEPWARDRIGALCMSDRPSRSFAQRTDEKPRPEDHGADHHADEGRDDGLLVPEPGEGVSHAAHVPKRKPPSGRLL